MKDFLLKTILIPLTLLFYISTFIFLISGYTVLVKDDGSEILFFVISSITELCGIIGIIFSSHFRSAFVGVHYGVWSLLDNSNK
jgi:hypothetical protein